MRIIENSEINIVTGGICNGKTLQECLSIGSTEVIERLGWSLTRSEVVEMLNEFGGDLGIWFYNVTHND